MSNGTFAVGGDVESARAVTEWQQWLLDRFDKWNIDYPLKITGRYDVPTRDATATLMRAWGVNSASDAMRHGLTAWWRTKLRNNRRSLAETARFAARVTYRRSLRNRYRARTVASPLAKVLADSWGWAPGHDGLDLICAEDAPLFAMCDGVIVRADPSGWWGKGAKPSPGHPVSDGDGVIVLRCYTNAGPFKPGLNFVYGHAEHATVKAGDKVTAGQVIGRAGYANAPHVHLCVNGRNDTKGIGDRDPRPFYDYARKHP